MKKIYYLPIIGLFFLNCTKENNFLVGKEQVGKILATTQVNELKDIFSNDSLVSRVGEGEFADAAFDEYLVYDKTGKHLLTIIPKEQHDSTSTIESIQIFDANYKTASGVGLTSTYKDVSNSYVISKVESTFTSAVLFVDEINATMAIAKKELGINDFGTQKVQADQIPDLAKLKSLTLWFD